MLDTAMLIRNVASGSRELGEHELLPLYWSEVTRSHTKRGADNVLAVAGPPHVVGH